MGAPWNQGKAGGPLGRAWTGERDGASLPRPETPFPSFFLTRSTLPLHRLHLLFLLSGATALLYEVVWMRMITLVLGATQLAIATVLAAFMGGLAAGGWALGRRVDRMVRPLRTYAILETIIALYALAFPWLLSSLSHLYRHWWRWTDADVGEGLPVHLASVLLLLFLPTAAMGGTLPLLARTVTTTVAEAGRKVGSLYTVNTFGAVLGTWLAGFVLLPYVGVQATLMVGAALNLLLAVAVLRLEKMGEAPVHSPKHSDEPLEMVEVHSPAPRLVRGATFAFAVSGLCAMIYEVAWSRVLTLILGNSVYAFSIMLMAFLLGIALGAGAGTRFGQRFSSLPPLASLVGCLLGVGWAAWGTTWTFSQMPYWYVALYGFIGGHDTLIYFVMLALAVGVMAPATVFMGAVMPLAAGVVVKEPGRVGRAVGNLYAWNTLGSIAGALLAGFILVPRLGIQETVRLAIGVNLLAALALAVLGGKRLLAWGGGLALLGGLLVTTLFPRWDPLLMSAGMYKYVDDLSEYSREAVRNHALSDFEVLYYREGVTTVVIVGKSRGSGNLWLANNGKVDASTSADMPTQVLLGHLPFHFAPRMDRTLLIGLASGITAGSILSEPVGHLDILEIEPAIIEATRYFEEWNNRPLADPRVKVVANDARNHLFLTEEPYDVIISEPSNPWISGVSNLFTEEFFTLGRDRLREDGVFCQWIQLYGMGTEDMKMLLRTFRSVFPHAWVYSTVEAGDLVLVGSRRPLALDVEKVERMVREPRAAQDLARVGVHSVADLMTWFLMDSDGLDGVQELGILNTDDNMHIEFSAPRMLHYITEDQNYQVLLQAAQGPWQVIDAALSQSSSPEAAAFYRRLKDAYVARERYGEGILAALRSLAREPDDEALRRETEDMRAMVLEAAHREEEKAREHRTGGDRRN